MVSHFIQFSLTLSLLNIEIECNDLKTRKSLACGRGVKITAAVKSDQYGKFYLFEEQNGWIYDFEQQKIENFIEDAYIKNRIGEGEKIARATADYNWDGRDAVKLQEGRFITANWNYEYRNISDPTTWTQEDALERFISITKTFDMTLEDFNLNELITVGKGSLYHQTGENRTYVHFYFAPDNLRICSKGCVARDGSFLGVYDLRGDTRILATSTPPDALAFEHKADFNGVRSIFVYQEKLYYWSEEDALREVLLVTLFGCQRYATILMIIVIVIGVFVALVIIAALVALVIVLNREKVSKFDERGSSTIAKGSTARGTKTMNTR